MKTIIDMLKFSVDKFKFRPYLTEKADEGWISKSFIEAREEVYIIASSLYELGFRKNDKIAILSEGRSSWVISELAVIHINGITVPLSIKLLPEELLFRLNHSEAKAIFVSKNNIEKLFQIYNQLNNKNFKILYFDENDEIFNYLINKYEINIKSENIIFYKNLLKIGKNRLEKEPELIDNIIKNIDENDVVSILYTSGTTGNPKGIMLTHLNYCSNVEDSVDIFQIPENYKTLIILPIDHSFAHTVALYGALLKAINLCFVDSRSGNLSMLKNIPINLKEVNPDFLLTVPAITGNFMKKIKEGVASKGKIINFIFTTGLNAGIKYNGNGYNNVSIFTKILNYFPYQIAKKLIFKKITTIFGKNLKFCIGGGALLDIKQQEFFYTLGIPVFQGYGLSEASPVISTNTPLKHKLGSSGIVLKSITCKIMKDDNTEAKTGEKGQIIIKGNNVMKGYFKNEEATLKTIKGGWLYTGDLGYFDKDGFLVVTGREKALLISEDGEKYSPEEIEEAIINSSDIIYQVMLYNDHKKYTIALITLDFNNLKIFIKYKKLSDAESILKEINKEFYSFSRLPEYKDKFQKKWIPSTFLIIEEPFSEKNKMINSTMKMVRYKIIESYNNLIDFLYTNEGKNFLNDKNIQTIKNILKNL